MKSPFPGMDPYMEAHWRDVHARLVLGACNELQHQLGGNLRARIDERLIVESDNDSIRSIYPDIRVFERGSTGRGVEPDGGVALAEPLVMEMDSDPYRDTFIRIIDVSSGGRIVTIVEFLPPANKLTEDGREKYRQKQEEAEEADINLVEIDLTRAGTRQLRCALESLPDDYHTPYLACVMRGFGRKRLEVYRIPLRERLPAIRIPLRKTDKDVALDLQKLVDQAYEEGRYDDINYQLDCIPALEAEDAGWAKQLLQAAENKRLH